MSFLGILMDSYHVVYHMKNGNYLETIGDSITNAFKVGIARDV